MQNPFTQPSGAPGSIGGVGAYTPDWTNLISSDPGLIDAANAITAGNAGDQASRDALIRGALVNFGYVPDLATLAKSLGLTEQDLSGVAGSGTQQLAKENTDAGLSTEARLNQANTDAIRQIRNELNKRGLLNSGEAGFQLDRQNTSFRQAQSDATQKLLGYLQQYQQGYAAAQAQKAQALAQAYSDAANRQYQTNQGSPGVTASFAFTNDAGQPVYRTPDGSLYNQDATPYPYAAPQPDAPAYTGGTPLGDYLAKLA